MTERRGGATRRILCVAPSMGVGGAERVLSELAASWHARGLAVGLALLSDEANAAFGVPAGVETIRIDGAGDSRGVVDALCRNHRRLADLRATIVRFAPDVVLGFTSHAGTLAVLAAKPLGVPAFLSERNFPPNNPIGRIWGALREVAYRQAAGIIMQTDRAAAWARTRVPPSRIGVIPNPLAPGFLASAPVAGRDDAVLYVGRLAVEKRPAWALRAFAAGAPPSWRLRLVGDGPLRADCERLARELGIADRTEFLGVRRDVADQMRRAPVLLATSATEGFPNAILEAMASGCVVVSSDCPAGPAELLDGGRCGLLAPVHDATALAAALRRAIDDPALRAALGAAAHERALQYTPERVMPRWDAMLGIAA